MSGIEGNGREGKGRGKGACRKKRGGKEREKLHSGVSFFGCIEN